MNAAIPEAVVQTGTAEAPTPPIPLRAGALTMLFEPDTCFLRYVRLGDREILRGVYAAVRDRNWGTPPARVSNLELDDRGDSFRLRFDVECREREIDFFWRGSVEGEPNGSVCFRMEGVARSTFLRSRIGFCVLHPVRECAGSACVVETADGGRVEGEFPRLISPHQPFKEMRAITHRVVPGVEAEVRFEGDIFEMEDQRNWTDASFKTYCTPLRLPYPVEVRAGERITQSVTVGLRGAVPAEGRAGPRETVVTLGDGPGSPLPSVGLGQASHGQGLTTREAHLLRALHPAHLRVDLHLADPEMPAVLQRAAGDAGRVGADLEVALFLSGRDETELRERADLLRAVAPPVRRWLLFHSAEKVTSGRWARLARAVLGDAAPVGIGTNAYFTELNRDRPDVTEADLVCYSINPQVHAFDNRSLVENLAAQAETVRSAREFCGDLPLVISPVTLRPRFNPNATGPEAQPAPGELPTQVDPRQMSLFGAGWTLGSLKYLAEAGVASVTFHETTGWRGVIERESGSPLPSRFPSIPGGVYPVYHVLADCCEFGGEVVRSTSDDPLSVESLALRHGARRRLLLANFTAAPRDVRVAGASLPDRASASVLDTDAADEAMRRPEDFRAGEPRPLARSEGGLGLTLGPYAVARLDWEDRDG